MSLPVSLSPGFYSIVPSVQTGLTTPSPNRISSNADSTKRPSIIVGLIDATDNTGTSQYSAGQYVWYNNKIDTVQATYQGKNYYIVNEKDILFAENPVIPPP